MGSLASGNNSCHSWCHDWCEPSPNSYWNLETRKLLQPKKKKLRSKQVKPVLHFIPNEDGTSDVIQYSQKEHEGFRWREKLEQYLRDQVEIDVLGKRIIKLLLMRNGKPTDQRR